MPAPAAFTPPTGCVVINDEPSEMWSEAAFDRCQELLKEADKCDPDLHDMYIYRDYYAYALEHILENELATFAKQLKKEPTSKKTLEQIEGILLFTCFESEFLTAADGDRVAALADSIAAGLHTVSANLHEATPSLLNKAFISNIENVLRTAILQLSDMATMCDPEVLEGTAQTLKVLLCAEGLDWSMKKDLIVGKSGEGDEEEEVEEEEAEDAQKSKKRKVVDPDEEIKELAALEFKKAEKELGHKVTQFRFSTVWAKYKKVDGYNLQEFKYRSGWSIED